MFIDGFGISSYRSFGEELQLIGPCNKINFIIGQNNSGKSNVLRFLLVQTEFVSEQKLRHFWEYERTNNAAATKVYYR